MLLSAAAASVDPLTFRVLLLDLALQIRACRQIYATPSLLPAKHVISLIIDVYCERELGALISVEDHVQLSTECSKLTWSNNALTEDNLFAAFLDIDQFKLELLNMVEAEFEVSLQNGSSLIDNSGIDDFFVEDLPATFRVLFFL